MCSSSRRWTSPLMGDGLLKPKNRILGTDMAGRGGE